MGLRLQGSKGLLTQLVSEPTREGASLDLLFINREGLVGDVVLRGHLGLGNHEMLEFLVRGEVKRGASKTTTMDFRRADFDFFGTLYKKLPWERVLKGKGLQEGWTLLKEEVLRHRNRLSQYATSWTGGEDDRPGWTGSCCWDSTTYGRKGTWLKWSTGVSLARAKRKSKRQKPI